MLTSGPGPDRRSTERGPGGNEAELVSLVIAGDPVATARVVALAPNRDDPALLVAAAVASGDRRHLSRACAAARTTRERQLVALADAHLRGLDELFAVLVREHLSEHPDHVLAAWVAARHP